MKKCIIHYFGYRKYSEVKEINELKASKIRDARFARELAGGGDYHETQCKMVPESFGPSHGVHLEPCYVKFISILDEARPSNETERRISCRGSQPLLRQSSWTFPEECNICKKGRIQHKGNKSYPKCIASFQAQETIKAAAKLRDPSMYENIKELDLIAKEFKMHDHCRKSFLKGFGKESREKLQLVSNAANFLLYLSPSLSLPQTFNIIFSFLRNTSKPQKRN